MDRSTPPNRPAIPPGRKKGVVLRFGKAIPFDYDPQYPLCRICGLRNSQCARSSIHFDGLKNMCRACCDEEDGFPMPKVWPSHLHRCTWKPATFPSKLNGVPILKPVLVCACGFWRYPFERKNDAP